MLPTPFKNAFLAYPYPREHFLQGYVHVNFVEYVLHDGTINIDAIAVGMRRILIHIRQQSGQCITVTAVGTRLVVLLRNSLWNSSYNIFLRDMDLLRQRYHLLEIGKR